MAAGLLRQAATTMDTPQLLQTFDTPFLDGNGDPYDVYAYAQSRPSDTWQAWLVFKRRRDGESFSTPAETSQPSREAALYWATGLELAYFQGAFGRTSKGITPPADQPARSSGSSNSSRPT